jgi:hypothetical protein
LSSRSEGSGMGKLWAADHRAVPSSNSIKTSV